MEKTIQIYLASTSFQLSESAYEKLRSYTESLKAHFAGDDRDEIMQDIESRIAEKLLEIKKAVITEQDVIAIIQEIGTPEQMEDSEKEETLPPSQDGEKKFYRDTEHAFIAGVCSGLAAYLNTQTWLLRLFFIISIFFGGAGIILYLVLWLLIPEAKSASDKLSMHGRPVTLEGISRIAKERADEVRKSGVLQRTPSAVGRLIALILRVIGRLLGFVLAIGALIGMIGIIIGFGIVIANWNAPYNDFALRGIVAVPLLFGGFTAFAIIVLIPLIFILTLGIRLFHKKIILPSSAAFGLAGVWIIALIAGGIMATKIAGQYFTFTNTSPDYQFETRTLNVPAFTDISVHDERITIKKGDVQEVQIHARRIDQDNITFVVKDGVLAIAEKDEYGRLCIFCRDISPEVTIITPDLGSVFIESGTAWFDEYADAELYIEMFYGSLRGKISSPALKIQTDGGTIRATLESDAITIDAEDAYVDLHGSAKTANLILEKSSFHGGSFSIGDASISTDASLVEMNVSGKATTNDDPSSNITNRSAETN